MLRKTVLSTIFIVSFCALPAFGADVKMKFPLSEALGFSSVKEALLPEVAVYWGSQPHPKVAERMGTFKTSKRTNGFRKAHNTACARAMASSIIVLQKRALREGGNAVINVTSNLNNVPESSTTEYSCMVGGLMVNVALEGDVVRLSK